MTAVVYTARVVLALAIGLALGSILPASLIARRKGVDIRSVGDGNPGTVNAFRGLGLAAGLVTLAYDFSVGVVAISIASLLGTSQGVAYLAGIMTIVGHRYPLFRGFRGGGKGMATSAGMLLYGAGVALSNGWLTLWGVVILAGVAGVAFAVTRSDVAISLVVLPALLVELIFGHPSWQFLVFMTTVAGHIWLTQMFVARRANTLGSLRPAHGGQRQ